MEREVLKHYDYRVTKSVNIELRVTINTTHTVLTEIPVDLIELSKLLNSTYIVGTENVNRSREVLIETDRYYINLYETFTHGDRVAIIREK